MNQAEYNGLQMGDCVRVRRSGKLYVAGWVQTAADWRAWKAEQDARSLARFGEPATWIPAERTLGEVPDVTFVQLRGDPAENNRYGALRQLRADAIERDAEATRAWVRAAVPRAEARLAEKVVEAAGAPADRQADYEADVEAQRRYVERLRARLVELEAGA
jgi:hypothetical protein